MTLGMTMNSDETLVKRLQLQIEQCAVTLTNANKLGASLSEADTERMIIRPLLLALGYDDLDFRQRSRDRGSMTFPDYTLLPDTPHRWVLEAKALDQRLGTKETRQTLGYASALACECAVLTNGRRWKVYHFPSQGVVLDVKDVFVDRQQASRLIILAKPNMMSNGLDNPNPNADEDLLNLPVLAKTALAREARAPHQPPSASSEEQATFSGNATPVLYPLARIAVEAALVKGRKPVEVCFSNGDKMEVGTWADVARTGIEFICSNFGVPKLPLALPGYSHFYLLNRQPTCADGTQMQRPLRVMIGGEPAFWDNARYARSDTVANRLLDVMRLVGASTDAISVAVL